MSSIQYAQSAPPAATAVKRPGVLSAALIATITAGAVLLIGAITFYAGGKEAIRSAAEDYFKAELGSLGELGEEMYDIVLTQAYESLSIRAGIGVFLAVLLLLAALLARNAATGGRVLLTVAVLLVVPFELLVISDFAPMALKATGGVAAVAGVVALVLAWLPPVSRFALDRALARRK